MEKTGKIYIGPMFNLIEVEGVPTLSRVGTFGDDLLNQAAAKVAIDAENHTPDMMTVAKIIVGFLNEHKESMYTVSSELVKCVLELGHADMVEFWDSEAKMFKTVSEL